MMLERSIGSTFGTVVAAFLVVFASACSNDTGTERSSAEPTPPPGASAFTAVASATSASTIGTPLACGAEWRIPIQRNGTRSLVFGGGGARCADGRFVELTNDERTDPALDLVVADRCAAGPFASDGHPVYFDRWAREISAQVELAGLRTAGIGFHVCPDNTTGKHVRVSGWQEANAVAQLTAEHMDAYDIDGEVYVLVGPVVAVAH